IYLVISRTCVYPHVLILCLSCVSHSCIHHIAVLPLALLISLTSGYVSNSIYKTLTHVCIQHVQILILFSLSTRPLVTLTSLCKLPNSVSILLEYSSFNLNSMLMSIKAILCLGLTSDLPDFQYLKYLDMSNR